MAKPYLFDFSIDCDNFLTVRIRKDGVDYPFSGASEVKYAILSADRQTVLVPAITASDDGDWVKCRLNIEVPAEDWADETAEQEVVLEIKIISSDGIVDFWRGPCYAYDSGIG